MVKRFELHFFLREIGKHFTINKMLTFESVKTRLEREQSLVYGVQLYDFTSLRFFRIK